MTDAVDVRSFIQTHRRAFLVSRTAAGKPTAHPMGLIPHDGAIYFNTYRKSAKVANIERDPRIACLVTSPDGDPAFASLIVQGRTEIVDASRLPDAMVRTGGVMSDEDLTRARARIASGKRVYLRVTVEQVTVGSPLASAAPDAGGSDGGWRTAVKSSPIAMTPDEVETYLRSRDTAAFATVDARGHPRAAAVRYGGGPGGLVALLPADGPSLSDLETDDRVCLTVDEFPTYDTIRGVLVHGRAHVMAGAPSSAVAVVPDRIVSFDFRKIAPRT